MSGYSNYVYTTDAGLDTSVMLPDDIAVALGMTLATTQPVLSSAIAPRYATFKSTTGLYRQGVIATVAAFGSIVGTTITLSSVVYTCTGAIAESITPYVPNTILNGAFLVQGPVGPAGPPGPGGGAFPLTLGRSINATGSLLASDCNTVVQVDSSGGPLTLTLPDPTTLTAGDVLLIAKADGSANPIILSPFSFEWIVYPTGWTIPGYPGGVFLCWNGGSFWCTLAKF